MNKIKLFVILSLGVISGCIIHKKKPVDVSLASRENNVCKILKGNVVVYAIFVDSKYTKPWTEYDIHSTLDSIKIGMNWIMKKAQQYTIPLDIQLVHHSGVKGIIPIYNDLSKKTLSATLLKTPQYSGIKDIYRWADKIALEAGKSLPKDTALIIKTQNKMSDRERLIARLRDIYKTDNVALMYFINNYYTNEISLTLDMNSQQNVEFSVVSFKRPSVIAHEFLHLFGAWDLYITPFDVKNDIKRKKQQAMKTFPNEIMAFAYRNIDSLDICQFTRYAIGWDNELEQKYSEMLFGKKLKPLKY